MTMSDLPEAQPALLRALDQGLQQMGIALAPARQLQLIQYLQLLDKWNRSFNLSAVREPSAMVSRHLLDSLTLIPFLQSMQSARILDVGTGPGLPGIPLAICLPQHHYVLLDSNGKKTRFVFQAKIALGLDNVSVENCRTEHYQSPEQIDIVVSRAFSTLAEMVSGTAQVNGPQRRAPRWLAMKGTRPDEEIKSLPAGIATGHITPVQIPGEPGERHIVEMFAAELEPDNK
jgi:16S rRNA (guanine527-N7)-methyltransferase